MTEREGPHDEDVSFEMPEDYFVEIQSGFQRAGVARGDEIDAALSAADENDVPQQPLAERFRRGT